MSNNKKVTNFFFMISLAFGLVMMILAFLPAIQGTLNIVFDSPQSDKRFLAGSGALAIMLSVAGLTYENLLKP